MENPFSQQAAYHKREAEKWSKAAKVVGIALIIIVFLLFGMC